MTPEQALAHPTWSMGPVITVNSATLVNKGLEVIEAHLLFDIGFDRIEVVVHPQSVIHSMVEFVDGSTHRPGQPARHAAADRARARLAGADRPAPPRAVDWTRAHTWTFEPLDDEAFPSVALARARRYRGRHGPGRLQRRQRGVRGGVPRGPAAVPRHRRHRGRGRLRAHRAPPPTRWTRCSTRTLGHGRKGTRELTMTTDHRSRDLTERLTDSQGLKMILLLSGIPSVRDQADRRAPEVPSDHGGFRAGGRGRAGVRAVDDHHGDRRHQRHPAADRRADRRRAARSSGWRCPPRTTPTRCRHRAQVADPGDRRHPLPAQVRLRRDRRRAARRSGSTRATSRSSTTRSGRSPGRPPTHGVPIRIGVNAGSLDPRLLAEVRQGHARGAGRVGAVGVLAVRGARLPRHQDLGQAQRPGRDDPGLPAARRAVRLPAAPGRHRGRPGLPGHDQVGGRVRRAAGRGHRRHHPGLAVGAAGRGGQGRQRRSWSRWTCASAGWRSSPARPAAGPRSTSTRSPSRCTAGLEG